MPARPPHEVSAFEQFCKAIGLELQGFQKRIAAAAFGPERELLVSLPRGNGKTTLCAALSLYHLLHRPQARVYCVAASAPQASILHDQAAAFARELGDDRLIDRYRELRLCPDPTR